MRTLFLSNLMSLDGYFARIGLRLTDVGRFDSGVMMLSNQGNKAQA